MSGWTGVGYVFGFSNRRRAKEGRMRRYLDLAAKALGNLRPKGSCLQKSSSLSLGTALYRSLSYNMILRYRHRSAQCVPVQVYELSLAIGTKSVVE